MSARMLPVPFDGDTLFLAGIDGEPYVPVRPISDALGLSWARQFRKLKDDEQRWSVALMATETPVGLRTAICIPLRKVFGWLMTIHPGRVKPEVRDKLRRYQEECDDALWAYWNDGVAVNPRARTKSHDELCREAMALPAPAVYPRRRGGRSVFHHDAEVRLFVEQLLATPATLTEVAETARARFGRRRAPSRSAVHRHDQRLRAAAADA